MSQASDSTLQFEFTCPLISGLHARPASHLAEVATQFVAECGVTNLRNGRTANGKSVLGVIAADIRHGDRCSVHVIGSDAPAAFSALRRFAETVLPQCDVPLAPPAASNRRTTPPRPLLGAQATFIPGTPVSRGIGHGKIVILKKMALPSGVDGASAGDPHRELERVQDAVSAVRHRIGEKLK